ncbi:ankyrin repeat-containing protein [Lecanora helva]
MPTATLPTLTEDVIDDLLYLARVGETGALTTSIDAIAKNLPSTPPSILAAAVDPNSGNGLLHMASANGHTETLESLLSLSPTSNNSTTISPQPSPPKLNIRNSSGNTPLHWAAVNGHVGAVKILVEAGADVTVLNKAGHDAVYEAEDAGKKEAVRWMLDRAKEGKLQGTGHGPEGSEGNPMDFEGEGGKMDGVKVGNGDAETVGGEGEDRKTDEGDGERRGGGGAS